jgi:hypothetical protein
VYVQKFFSIRPGNAVRGAAAALDVAVAHDDKGQFPIAHGACKQTAVAGLCPQLEYFLQDERHIALMPATTLWSASYFRGMTATSFTDIYIHFLPLFTYLFRFTPLLVIPFPFGGSAENTSHPAKHRGSKLWNFSMSNKYQYQ